MANDPKETAAWDWFFDFCSRFRALRESPAAMRFLADCRDVALRGGGLPIRNSRYWKAHHHAGQDGMRLLDRAQATVEAIARDRRSGHTDTRRVRD